MKIEEHRQNQTRSFNANLREATVPLLFDWNDPSTPMHQIGGEPRGLSGYPFQGENAMQLAMASKAQGFTSPQWLTTQQANALGGRIRRGQVATKVISKVSNEDGKSYKPVLMNYFNADQITGMTLPVQQGLSAEQQATRQEGLDALIAPKKKAPTLAQYNAQLRKVLNEQFPTADNPRENAKATIRREFAMLTAQARLGLPRVVEPSVVEDLKPLVEDRLHWVELKSAMEQANKALTDIGIKPSVFDRIEKKTIAPEVKPADKPKVRSRAKNVQKDKSKEMDEIPF